MTRRARAENGTWRNFFLMGAHELRHGPGGTAATIPSDFIVNLSNEQLFDALAIQIDGPRAGDRRITLHWRFTDTGEEYALTLQHGVLVEGEQAELGELLGLLDPPDPSFAIVTL